MIVKAYSMLENSNEKNGTTINVSVTIKTHKKLCMQRRLWLESYVLLRLVMHI